jgi:xanthine dehydrogenase accessory factor
VLKAWIRQPFAFLGMIGSRRKARLIFDQFLTDKIASPDQISRVACPVGLAIGAITPPEIAISILGQLIQRRSEVLGAAGPAIIRPLAPKG